MENPKLGATSKPHTSKRKLVNVHNNGRKMFEHEMLVDWLKSAAYTCRVYAAALWRSSEAVAKSATIHDLFAHFYSFSHRFPLSFAFTVTTFFRYMLIKECLQTAWSVAEQSHEMSQVYTRCTNNWQSTFESSVGFFLLSSSYSFILLVRRQTKSNYVWQHAFALFKASHIFVTRAINSCSWRGGSWLMSFLFGRMVDIHKSEWIFCI